MMRGLMSCAATWNEQVMAATDRAASRVRRKVFMVVSIGEGKKGTGKRIKEARWANWHTPHQRPSRKGRPAALAAYPSRIAQRGEAREGGRREATQGVLHLTSSTPQGLSRSAGTPPAARGSAHRCRETGSRP